MLRSIRPAYVALGLLFEVATVIVATKDVSILVVYAGFCLTITTVLLGYDDREYQRRRR